MNIHTSFVHILSIHTTYPPSLFLLLIPSLNILSYTLPSPLPTYISTPLYLSPLHPSAYVFIILPYNIFHGKHVLTFPLSSITLHISPSPSRSCIVIPLSTSVSLSLHHCLHLYPPLILSLPIYIGMSSSPLYLLCFILSGINSSSSSFSIL